MKTDPKSPTPHCMWCGKPMVLSGVWWTCECGAATLGQPVLFMSKVDSPTDFDFASEPEFDEPVSVEVKSGRNSEVP